MIRDISLINFNKLCFLNCGNSMLIIGDRYGYRLNVNHPFINLLYVKYKTEVLKTRAEFPISDRERLRFEDKTIIKLIENGWLKYE